MRQIILASESARRQELLAKMGMTFQPMRSDYDEQLDENRDVAHVAEELGLGKALAVAEKYPEAFVIGSDTIVSFEGRQLGKQPDEATARKLLERMSGQVITVTTSVALVCKALGLEGVRHEVAKVVFGQFSEHALSAYLQSGDWSDKAGAVAIQSKYWPAVDHIEGSYATVLGLPTQTLAAMLQKQGVDAVYFEPEAPWLLRESTQSA